MARRKFSKCAWCRRTIDITNEDREFCAECSKFSNLREATHYYKSTNQTKRIAGCLISYGYFSRSEIEKRELRTG